MALQNFVDKVGPVVSAAWLNMVDVLSTTVFQNAGNPSAARTALFSDAPLEVANGGTGVRVAPSSPFILVTKPGNTNRSNTATPANDPDLIITIPAAGQYIVTHCARVSAAVAGAVPGLNANINFSGTFDTTNSTGWMQSTANAFAYVIANTSTQVKLSDTNLQTFITPNFGTAILICSTGGTLAFAWSQNTSSGNATTINAGSWLMTQRIV